MTKAGDDKTVRYADMFAALGAEPRLRILRLLLSAHPDGLVVGEIQAETGVSGSTLSHHLEKLKTDELVTADREKAFIRYRANTKALEELLGSSTRNVARETRRSNRSASWRSANRPGRKDRVNHGDRTGQGRRS